MNRKARNLFILGLTILLGAVASPLSAADWKSAFDTEPPPATSQAPTRTRRPRGYSTVVAPAMNAFQERQAGGGITYLRAEPDHLPADGRSTAKIIFKIVTPGRFSLRLTPNVGRLITPSRIVEDRELRASYRAPTAAELGPARQVTIAIIPETGPAAKVTISFDLNSDDRCSDLNGELRTLLDFGKQLETVENRARQTRIKVRFARVAISKARKNLAATRQRLATCNQYQGYFLSSRHGRQALENEKREVSRLQKLIADMGKEQTGEIEKIKGEFDQSLDRLDGLNDSLTCPDVKKALKDLRRFVVERRDLIQLDLYLAGGDLHRFRKLLQEYRDSGKYAEKIPYYEALDLIENGKRSGALYKLRDAVKKFPDSKLLKKMLANLEVGYLKAINAQVHGEAAQVRALAWERFKEYGEKGWWGYLSSTLDMGLVTTTRTLIGDFDKLELLQSVQLHDAAVTETGLMILIRLREKGLSLEEIRGLNNQQFISMIKEKYGQELAPKTAMHMRYALTYAYQNRDVRRLFMKDQQQFDIDFGRSYYDKEAFAKTWLESAYDAIDAKNLALFLGPNAVMAGSVGRAWYTLGSGMSEAELLSAATVGDVISETVGVNKIIEILARHPWGRAAAEYMCKFKAESGTTKKLVAEALVQSGIIGSAAMVPGAPGKAAMVAAEIMVTFAGLGDIDKTVRILRKCGVRAQDVGKVARRILKLSDEAAAVAVTAEHRALLDQAIKQLDSGGQLSPELKKALKKEGEKYLARLRKQGLELARKTDNPLGKQAVNQGGLLLKAGEDAVEGKAAAAKLLKQRADEVGAGIEASRKKLGRQAEELKKIEDGLKQPGSREVKSSLKRDAIASLDSNPQKRKLPPEDAREEAKRLYALFSSAGKDYSMPMPAHKILREADEALLEGNYEKAAAKYREVRHLSEAMEHSGQAGNIIDNYRHAADDAEKKRLLAKKTEAEASRIIAPGQGGDNPVRAAISDQEQKSLNDAISRAYSEAKERAGRRLKALAEENGQSVDDLQDKYRNFYREELNRRIPAAAASSGEGTAYEPRVIEIEGRKYLFKPGMKNNEGKDIKTEIVASRLAAKLGLDAPACARVSYRTGDKQIEGVVMRYVEDSHDLTVARPETLVAVKRHVAEDRVLSLLIGDHDRRPANFLVSGKRVYTIDHQLGDLLDSGFRDKPISEMNDRELYDNIKLLTERRMGLIKSFQESRWHPSGKAIEELIRPEDFQPALDRLRKLDRNDLEKLVDGLYPEGSQEQKNAIRYLKMRKKVLLDLLGNGQSSILPLFEWRPGIPEENPGWRQAA